MVDILQFYKETTERPAEDQVLEKFHHANGAPGMYPTAYTGQLTSNPSCLKYYRPNLRRNRQF